jgi:hypothetical protein
MVPAVRSILSTLVLLVIAASSCGADASQWSDTIPLVTTFTQQSGPEDPPTKARALALFGAKQEAVRTAAKYLTHKGLLEHYGHKESEIFCLAVNEIEAEVIEAQYRPQDRTYTVKVRTATTIVDFIRAQIKDLEMEKEEAAFSYTKEMEQPVMAVVDPAVELSRAYRYIRKQQWRIAIIYLDHLEKKYPYWGELFLARAIALYGMNATEQMAAALHQACTLNNQEACRELRSLAP